MRRELKINKCLGIDQNGELIMVREFFEYSPADPLINQGVTGASFCPVYQSDIDDRNDIDRLKEDYDYLWTEAVKAGSTEMSLEDYLQMLVDESDGSFFGHDTSWISEIPSTIQKTHFDGAETFECVGCGRMFPTRSELMIVFDQDLLDAVNAYEAGDINLEMVADLLGEAVQGE